MEEKGTEQKKFCFGCKKYVITYYTSTSCIGQYGTNVIGHEICPNCEYELRNFLIDKDI